MCRPRPLRDKEAVTRTIIFATSQIVSQSSVQGNVYWPGTSTTRRFDDKGKKAKVLTRASFLWHFSYFHRSKKCHSKTGNTHPTEDPAVETDPKDPPTSEKTSHSTMAIRPAATPTPSLAPSRSLHLVWHGTPFSLNECKLACALTIHVCFEDKTPLDPITIGQVIGSGKRAQRNGLWRLGGPPTSDQRRLPRGSQWWLSVGRLGAKCLEHVVGSASSSIWFMAVGWLDVGETAAAGVLGHDK